MKFKNKKGQVTMFIIIGIILLIAVSLSIVLMKTKNEWRPEIPRTELGDEIKPVQSYIQDCLISTSQNSIIKIMNRGGYLIPPQSAKIIPGYEKAYDSDFVEFTPYYIPYWHYLDNNCKLSSLGCISTQKPPLCKSNTNIECYNYGDNSIQEQLEKDISKNILTCINNFQNFKEEFDFFPKKDPKIDVIFTDYDTKVHLTYPVEVQSFATDSKGLMQEEYDVSIDAPVLTLYKTADTLSSAEKKYGFLEDITKQLIILYSSINSEQTDSQGNKYTSLPPMSGTRLFSFEKDFWFNSKVKEQIRYGILPYMNFIKIMGSDNFDVILSNNPNEKERKYENGIYQMFYVNIPNFRPEGLDINFYYDDWKPYVKVGDSEMIKPKSYDFSDVNKLNKMLNVVIDDYRFKYNINFPVVASITDKKALSGKGLTLNFALESNILNNEQVTERLLSNYNQSFIPSANGDNPHNMPKRNITISVFDKHTHKPINDAVISYYCGFNYDIGSTRLNEDSMSAIYVGQLPYCAFGGYITATKKGYLTSGISFNNVDGIDPKKVSIELWPLQKKEIIVKKRSYDDLMKISLAGTNGFILSQTQYSDLSPYESAMVEITRNLTGPYATIYDDPAPLNDMIYIKATNKSKLKSNFNIFNSEKSIAQINSLYKNGTITEDEKNSMLNNLEEFQNIDFNINTDTPNLEFAEVYDFKTGKIKKYNPSDDKKIIRYLVPGKYKIDATLMNNKGFTLPSKKEEICLGFDSPAGCLGMTKEITFPQTNFTMWFTGGANIEFEISEDQTYTDKPITIFLLEEKLPETWDEFESFKSVEDIQKGRESLVTPIFTK